LAERRAREGAGQDADEGDADLNGREKAARLLGQRQRRACTGPTRVGHRLEAGFSGGDDGELGQGEQPVEGDEAEGDDGLEHEGLIEPARRGATGPLRCCRWVGR
jgi:hypothetical protein